MGHFDQFPPTSPSVGSVVADEESALENADMAKALVMAELARIVEEGAAVIATVASGTIELRFATGEVFRLGETTVTRIA
jgi:alpha-D-ribose 1-methylphosphonate 5-triphosphate synthase subunit PhnG